MEPALVVGHYKLDKTLGLGAFGKVKLAQHLVTNQKVAIKILNKGKIRHMEMVEKVRREINILKMCTHPHIIRLYEVIDTPSDIFMVMEYVAGGELFDYIVSRGRLAPDEARQFFHQIVSGVEYCHYHGIVHRDLKPENLLLDADNNIKIADFGLSNVIHDGYFLRSSCGSPNYAAPEVISGNLYAGSEVDVWSCGVILYALLCGTLPFDDESIPNLFKKIKSGMYSLPSHLSQLSRDLILRMLVVDPIKRISIAEIRQHQWFLHKLPAYLALPPEQIEQQHRTIDQQIIREVARMSFSQCTEETILAAVNGEGPAARRTELKVAYNLLLDAKKHKQRIADMAMAMQDPSRTPTPASPVQPHGSTGRTLEDAARALSRASGAPPQPHPQENPTRPPPGVGQGRRRRWYLGIQSKKDPAHVMTEVYKALKHLNCGWKAMTSYRILCLWVSNAPRAVSRPAQHGVLDFLSPYLGGPAEVAAPFRPMDGLAGGPAPQRVKAGLSLYKVQHGIYLLDFQKVEGDPFSFMQLCSLIITELKTLSAASRKQEQAAQAAAAAQHLHAHAAHVGVAHAHVLPQPPGAQAAAAAAAGHPGGVPAVPQAPQSHAPHPGAAVAPQALPQAHAVAPSGMAQPPHAVYGGEPTAAAGPGQAPGVV